MYFVNNVHRFRSILWFGAVALAATAAFAAGSRDDVVALFSGAGTSATSLDASRKRYEQLVEANPRDGQLEYAYALVLAKGRQYRQALPLVQSYLEENGGDLEARQIEIWLLVQERRFDEALDAMTALARKLPLDVDDQAEISFAVAADFLGSMCGFLSIVRTADQDRDDLHKARQSMVARVKAPYLAVFDEARLRIERQLATLQSQRNARQMQTANEAVQRRKVNQADQEIASQKLLDGGSDAQSHAGNVLEAERSLGVIETQLASLSRDRLQIGIQIIALQTQAAELAPVQQIIGGRNLPTQIQSLLRNQRVTTAEDMVRVQSIASSLALLVKQATDMDREIAKLQVRAAELAQQGALAAEALAETEEELADAAELAELAEKRLAREEQKAGAKVAPLTGQMKTLSTYLPFPFERERQRVLNWFADPAGK